jgi:hypothetical protein
MIGLSIHLEQETLDAIAKQADDEKRTRAAMIRLILEQHVQEVAADSAGGAGGAK